MKFPYITQDITTHPKTVNIFNIADIMKTINVQPIDCIIYPVVEIKSDESREVNLVSKIVIYNYVYRYPITTCAISRLPLANMKMNILNLKETVKKFFFNHRSFLLSTSTAVCLRQILLIGYRLGPIMIYKTVIYKIL